MYKQKYANDCLQVVQSRQSLKKSKAHRAFFSDLPAPKQCSFVTDDTITELWLGAPKKEFLLKLRS